MVHLEYKQITTDLRPLARCTRRHIATLLASLASSNTNPRPSPVRAATLTTQNVDISRAALNSTSHFLHGEISDRDPGSGSSSRATILIVLLDNNALLRNRRQLDIGEGDLLDGARRAGNGLDPDSVVRVRHLGVGDGDVLNVVVVAPADGSDAQAVAARAGATGEEDVLRKKISWTVL